MIRDCDSTARRGSRPPSIFGRSPMGDRPLCSSVCRCGAGCGPGVGCDGAADCGWSRCNDDATQERESGPGKTVAIIGAGVSGLACIKACLEEGLRPVCFESTPDIGGVWVYREDEDQRGPGRLYHSAVTNTSKEMMCFSDFPPPRHFPPFLRHNHVLAYLLAYADFFRLRRCVRTESEVVRVEKADDHVISGQWWVTVRSKRARNDNRDDYSTNDDEMDYIYDDDDDCDDDEGAIPRPATTCNASGSAMSDCGRRPFVSSFLFDAVIVATGILSKINLPAEDHEGYFQFEGLVMHGCQYRRPDAFKDKTVVIVGGANTAGDVAVEIGNVAKQVYLSTRHGSWILGRTAKCSTPWDMSSFTRFNHLLLPSWMRSNIAEKLIRLRIDHEKIGLKCDKNFQRGQKMINDSIDVSILSGKIVVKPGVRCFTRRDIVFTDFTKAVDVDVVIFATGYHHAFPFLTRKEEEEEDEEEEEEDEEEGFLGVKRLDLYLHVFPPRETHDSIAFVGCFEPMAAVAPAIELQARWVARVFAGRAALPCSVAARLGEMRERRVHDAATMGYGAVDLNDAACDAVGRKAFPIMEYQEDLASRIGCRPPFLDLFLSGDWRLLLSLVFGPCHPASYRICGPGSWRGARGAVLNAEANTDGATRTRMVEDDAGYFGVRTEMCVGAALALTLALMALALVALAAAAVTLKEGAAAIWRWTSTTRKKEEGILALFCGFV